MLKALAKKTELNRQNKRSLCKYNQFNARHDVLEIFINILPYAISAYERKNGISETYIPLFITAFNHLLVDHPLYPKVSKVVYEAL